ncbi:hypothetical protein CLAFUW4_08472 [Fulvia fulva]|uniref:Uncharacterized protein n=1 Tax=Passalora fulva TaxID=5499 RepID=A0A9Q8P6T6_PASFU|nr:uncharacterized protein CLAFUR5_08576 [Fulvia fulva]KAK4628790.1 hypothetical protein CLAFUR4_08477 [Fulvia fulva]KAK4629926.1 hypothetical protein CLAFUR0_08472 [Fulvia fulva]UJO15373.1 hypothetical protein CLAFUR5_08576 [Fulvia fulva]WPV12030.1 hypothetical protein CLAFUW4_08472 [Fulvia fulva]WPV27979.1 hypothetical protein CLAFUW7_08472 [Fulvia fulva]
MTANDGLMQALQDSLTQLAHSFQAIETSITVKQIAECFEHLQDAHRTALDRLFFLIYQRNHIDSSSPGSCAIIRSSARSNNRDHAIQEQSSNSTRPSVLRKVAPAPPPSQSSTTPRPINVSAPNINVSADTAVRAAHSKRQWREKGNDRSGILTETIAKRSIPNPDLLPEIPSPQDRRQLPTSGLALTCIEAQGPARCITDITFPATIRPLLQTCMSDPSAFLRAVTAGKVSLPDGQGWEAAIATKSNNADLRDLTRIFHRFECYNIYQHVVEAGYHTGSHWIREMRPLLAHKLCHDLPAHFIDQKAANKCLQWVDQGCRYREWAEKLSGSAVNLGYLVALPCNVPHSTYTSRCTKEQIVAAVLELKRLGIDDAVEQLELSHLANHIVISLREMTAGKRAEPSELPANETSRPIIDHRTYMTPQLRNYHHLCSHAVEHR